MNEIDSDIDSITSSVLADKTNYTPTPSLDLKLQSGSILRHVIFQGVTAQIGSAAVRLKKFVEFHIKSICNLYYFNSRIERKLVMRLQLQYLD